MEILLQNREGLTPSSTRRHGSGAQAPLQSPEQGSGTSGRRGAVVCTVRLLIHGCNMGGGGGSSKHQGTEACKVPKA